MKKILLSVFIFGIMVFAIGLTFATSLVYRPDSGIFFISPEENQQIGGEFLVEWENEDSFPDVYLQIGNDECNSVENWEDLGSFPNNIREYMLNTEDYTDGANCLRLAGDTEWFDMVDVIIDNTNPTASVMVIQDGEEADVSDPQTRTEIFINVIEENSLAICDIDWKDGSHTNCLANPTGNYDHQYGDNDGYAITLTVEDGAGNQDTDSDTADVVNVVPWNVNITTTTEIVAVGEAVLFEATAEDVNADMPLTFTWTFGSVEVVSEFDDGHVYYTWTEPGTYAINLEVKDKDNGKTDAEPHEILVVEATALDNQEVIAFHELEADFEGNGNRFEHGVANGVCEKVSPGNPGLTITTDNGDCVVTWSDPRPTNDEQGENMVIVKVSNNGDYEYYSFVITIYSWMIELDGGWNLFSIPLVHETGNINDVIPEEVRDHVDKIWSYEYDDTTGESVWSCRKTTSGGSWSSSACATGVPKIETIVPGRGYFIQVKEDETATIKGFGNKVGPIPNTPPEIKVPLWEWFLGGRYGIVGTTQGEAGELNKETALMNLDGNTKVVVGYNGLNYEWTNDLTPQEGYWVIVSGGNHDTGTYTPIDEPYSWN